MWCRHHASPVTFTGHSVMHRHSGGTVNHIGNSRPFQGTETVTMGGNRCCVHAGPAQKACRGASETRCARLRDTTIGPAARTYSVQD
jgi:hypothetical protein